MIRRSNTHRKSAYLDTTIVTDVLLKDGEQQARARRALAKFRETLLPMYAVKEFKAGPLGNAKYAYNKLLDVDSVPDLLQAIMKNSRSPYKMLTAANIVLEGMKRLDNVYGPELQARFGKEAHPKQVYYDHLRLDLKTAIFTAWKKLDSLATKRIHPLACFHNQKPAEKRTGKINFDPTGCSGNQCVLSDILTGPKMLMLTHLKVAIDQLPADIGSKREHRRRADVISKLMRIPHYKLTHNECRWLGDAIFAIFCPLTSQVLTTNARDLKPLTESLRKVAVTPDEIIGNSEDVE